MLLRFEVFSADWMARYDPGAAAMVEVLDSMVDVGVVDDLGASIADVDMGAAEIPPEGSFVSTIG